MRAARATLKRRLKEAAQQLREPATKKHPECTVRLDRLRVTSTSFPKENFRNLPGFRPGPDHWAKNRNPQGFHAYGRVQWFESEKDGSKFCVEYEPKKPWLRACCTTMFADDEKGLRPEEVFRILELLPNARLTLVELAFDFAVGSRVDAAFVRRHGLFGKSRPRAQKNSVHYWGSRKAAKMVRSYYKPKIAAQRVELELRTRFLKHYGIRSVFDFPRLAKLLPRRHIYFAGIDWDGVAECLERLEYEEPRILLIYKQDNDLGTTLRTTLGAMRRELDVLNPHRFLIPLAENSSVCGALKLWTSMWGNQARKIT